MKKTLVLLFLFVSISAIADSFKIVGQVNMISTRNIDSGVNYELLKTGTDDSKKALKELRADNLDGAIDNAVKNVAGGEFLKNVKIYFDGKYFAVIGDVWGVREAANVEGFRIGDQVYFKNSLINKTISREKYIKAKITSFKDNKTCMVTTENGEIKEVAYKDLSKSGE